MAIEFSPEGEIKAACVDGYSNGSISTKFYNPAAVVPYMTQKWNNLNIHNITIKEWTDYVNKVNFDANGENKYKTMQYRIPELQDCEIISTKATDYPGDQTTLSLKRNTQTYEIEYRKPFQVSELNDVELLPGLEYNLTSYFGCYQIVKTSEPDPQ